jgi:hypothetical protein
MPAVDGKKGQSALEDALRRMGLTDLDVLESVATAHTWEI